MGFIKDMLGSDKTRVINEANAAKGQPAIPNIVAIAINTTTTIAAITVLIFSLVLSLTCCTN